MSEKRRRISPYLEWAVLTDFAYLKGEWFWVLLELDEPAELFARSIARPELERLIRIPSIYHQVSPPSLREADVTCCMAIVSREALVGLVSGRGPRHGRAEIAALSSTIRRIELGTPTTNLFAKSDIAVTPSLAARPSRRTIVAIIDDGLAFAHERFRVPDGRSRVKYFWNQDDATNTNPPAGFGWGRELASNEINQLLAACTHGGLLDEDAFYRRAGQDLVHRRAKHGTHVMDIACGADPRQPVQEDHPLPDIIAVQLPRWVTEETSGAFLTPNVYAALSYVLSRADQIAAEDGTGPIPVVANLSYGTIAGPHDGTAQLEVAIDQLISARAAPFRVVLPAGNHYLARCRAHLELPKTPKRPERIEQLRWRAQPDDKAASFMELWLPELTTQKSRPEIAIRVTTPTHERSEWLVANQEWRWPLSGALRFWATYVAGIGERPYLFLAMAPTADFRAAPLTAPSGTWLIDIKNVGAASHLDAWIQRGDTPFGYPLSGRQSRFEDSDYQRFDLAGRVEEVDKTSSRVRREATINALGTGAHAIVVGAFIGSTRKASAYSGAGGQPVSGAPATIRSPDLSAVADETPVLRNLLAAGTRTGSVVAMNGTSVAAPQATRLISCLMMARKACDRLDIQAVARACDPTAPGAPLDIRLGAGRIEMTGRAKRR